MKEKKLENYIDEEVSVFVKYGLKKKAEKTQS